MDRTESFVRTVYVVTGANEQDTRAIIENMRVYGYIQETEYSRMNTLLNDIAPFASQRTDHIETIEEARRPVVSRTLQTDGPTIIDQQEGGYATNFTGTPEEDMVTFKNEWPSDWKPNEQAVEIAAKIDETGSEFVLNLTGPGNTGYTTRKLMDLHKERHGKGQVVCNECANLTVVESESDIPGMISSEH